MAGKDAAQALEKVTDYVEDKKMDEKSASQAGAALEKINDAPKAALDERVQRFCFLNHRMKELSSVQVKPEDVQVIVQELEITKQQADMLLRENQGDLVKALRAAV